MLAAKRDVSAARQFFKKMMRAEQRRLSFSISVDKNAVHLEAFSASHEDMTTKSPGNRSPITIVM
jgi:transposase-like protein